MSHLYCVLYFDVFQAYNSASFLCFLKYLKVFPDSLLAQLLKTMMHPDLETRVGAHQIFSVLLGQNLNHPRRESEYLFETKKWQSRTSSVFESATALLEKLRKEKECLNGDKKVPNANDGTKMINLGDEEWKNSWVQKNLPYFSTLSRSIIDRIVTSPSSLDHVSILHFMIYIHQLINYLKHA